MSRLKAAVLLSLCAACAGRAPVAADAQRAAAGDAVTARAKGRRAVVVRERGRPHLLDLTGRIDAARIEDVTELFLTRKGGFVYLVLDVCGLSKVPPDNRHCGAGTECNLVWLKLDESWRERDAKSEHYESCWLPLTPDEGPTATGRTLRLEYDDLREDLRHEVTYDADKPEEGLTSRTRPLPKENP